MSDGFTWPSTMARFTSETKSGSPASRQILFLSLVKRTSLYSLFVMERSFLLPLSMRAFRSFNEAFSLLFCRLSDVNNPRRDVAGATVLLAASDGAPGCDERLMIRRASVKCFLCTKPAAGTPVLMPAAFSRSLMCFEATFQSCLLSPGRFGAGFPHTQQ